METTEKYKILIVDDATENLTMLITLLKHEYEIFVAKNGKTALEIAKTKRPDLILLDIIMPEMDGYDVCRTLKKDSLTSNIPVIFVTMMNEEEDEANGFTIGAVDYITKPFKPAIVKSRIKTHLKLKSAMEELKRLYSLALDANPITKLPGNNSIMATISRAIKSKQAVCVIYADLDHFKAFNDKYGFAYGDAVILFTGNVLKRATQEAECEDAFIGHIGGDDFVLVVPSDKCQNTVRHITRIFDNEIIDFYKPEDASAKCIMTTDRQGKSQIYQMMSISMAGVDLSHGIYENYIQISDVCANLKKKAKAHPGSHFCMDQRVLL